ncbi:unnamed protein product [Protopolystoma xenopodis]|uniref:Uncharacterized protein n=1 Tax=Protopolystoma xenopodis TaxID=117903 RepID=A0A448WB79_9PLAT|nr:unnamed protein product [Protopolystoma xenopodis]
MVDARFPCSGHCWTLEISITFGGFTPKPACALSTAAVLCPQRDLRKFLAPQPATLPLDRHTGKQMNRPSVLDFSPILRRFRPLHPRSYDVQAALGKASRLDGRDFMRRAVQAEQKSHRKCSHFVGLHDWCMKVAKKLLSCSQDGQAYKKPPNTLQHNLTGKKLLNAWKAIPADKAVTRWLFYTKQLSSSPDAATMGRAVRLRVPVVPLPFHELAHCLGT